MIPGGPKTTKNRNLRRDLLIKQNGPLLGALLIYNIKANFYRRTVLGRVFDKEDQNGGQKLLVSQKRTCIHSYI